MKPEKSLQTMCVYASESQYLTSPTTEQQANGTIPLDTLPADWWNWLWKEITTRINEAASDVQSVYQELLSILQAANMSGSADSTNQLLTAIRALIRVPGTSTTAGTVKSSADSGKVAIDENGYMTPNGMGIPTSLNTTAKTIVGAINEVLTSYTSYKTATDTCLSTLQSTKAPTNHASSGTTYGVGNGTNYGHLKLSNAIDSASGAFGGIAATPASVKCAYDLANTANTTANSKTSCIGTVTSVKVGNISYNPSGGVISLPAYTTVSNATTNAYGTVKISDNYTASAGNAANAVAASSCAVYLAYTCAKKAGDDAMACARAVASCPGISCTGTITGIRMNGTSKGTSGIVNLGSCICCAGMLSGTYWMEEYDSCPISLCTAASTEVLCDAVSMWCTYCGYRQGGMGRPFYTCKKLTAQDTFRYYDYGATSQYYVCPTTHQVVDHVCHCVLPQSNAACSSICHYIGTETRVGTGNNCYSCTQIILCSGTLARNGGIYTYGHIILAVRDQYSTGMLCISPGGVYWNGSKKW